MFKKSLVVFVAISLIATGIFAFWQPLYNLRTKIFGDDVKVTGVLKEIKVEPGEGWLAIIESEGKEYEVIMGPIWLYEGMKEGEEISIEGKEVEIEGNEYVVAFKVEINGKEYEIRDEYGRPSFIRERMNDSREFYGKRWNAQNNFKRMPRGRMMRAPRCTCQGW